MAALTYRPSDGGSVSVRVHRVGDRDDRDYSGFPPAPIRLGWYTRGDLAAELRLTEPRASTPGSTLSLRIDNVTNERYQTVHGFDVAGRTVLGGLRIDF
jgi:outer membrane cobalamin receptor